MLFPSIFLDLFYFSIIMCFVTCTESKKMSVLKQFNNGYRITSDEAYNLVLEKQITRKKKDTGEEYEAWDTIGYYSNIYSLLNSMVNHSIIVTKSELDFIPNLQRIESALLSIAKDANLVKHLKPQAFNFSETEQKLTTEPPKKKRASRVKQAR